MLSACSTPIVQNKAVNHAYDGQVKRLAVYNNLYEGERQKNLVDFDTQFMADMQRCGISARIVDSGGLELNSSQHIIQAIHDTSADSLLIATWTHRRIQNSDMDQDSLFTLKQIHYSDKPNTNMGEVWKLQVNQATSLFHLNTVPEGSLLAMRVVDQLELDGMLKGCNPRPTPAT